MFRVVLAEVRRAEKLHPFILAISDGNPGVTDSLQAVKDEYVKVMLHSLGVVPYQEKDPSDD